MDKSIYMLKSKTGNKIRPVLILSSSQSERNGEKGLLCTCVPISSHSNRERTSFPFKIERNDYIQYVQYTAMYYEFFREEWIKTIQQWKFGVINDIDYCDLLEVINIYKSGNVIRNNLHFHNLLREKNLREKGYKIYVPRCRTEEDFVTEDYLPQTVDEAEYLVKLAVKYKNNSEFGNKEFNGIEHNIVECLLREAEFVIWNSLPNNEHFSLQEYLAKERDKFYTH